MSRGQYHLEDFDLIEIWDSVSIIILPLRPQAVRLSPKFLVHNFVTRFFGFAFSALLLISSYVELKRNGNYNIIQRSSLIWWKV